MEYRCVLATNNRKKETLCTHLAVHTHATEKGDSPC